MDGACRARERAPGRYTPRRPSQSVLYRCVQEHLATWLAQCRDGHHDAGPVPAYVEREFRRYLECGFLPMALPGRGAGSADTTSCSRSRARGAACAPRAARGAWWRRQRISPITSCRTCRCGNGYSRCRSGCAIFWNATPNFRVLLYACSCARWSNACARTVLVRAPRLVSVRSPSSTASAPPSM